MQSSGEENRENISVRLQTLKTGVNSLGLNILGWWEQMMSVGSCSQRQRSRLLLVSLTTLFNKCTQQSQQDPKCGVEKERETLRD